MNNLTVKERVIRSKIRIQRKVPFFGYLLLHLNPIIDEASMSIGVDKQGNMYINSEFVNGLSELELEGVCCHEVCHCVFEDFERISTRDERIWNIATDLVINEMLVSNRFALPEGALIPVNHAFTFGDKTIVNLNKKVAEEVYDEIIDYIDKNYVYCFDVHIYGGGKSGNKNGPNGKTLAEKGIKINGGDIKNWKKILSEAAMFGKMQGKLPMGAERLVDSILFPKLNWKRLLSKYISESLISDMTYERPSTSSIVSEFYSEGFYLPSIKDEEMLDIVVSIDTSGSISKDDINTFASEIYAIFQNFEQTTVKVITCDAKIQDEFDLNKRNYKKLKNLKIHGFGGTSHIPIYERVKELNKKNRVKLLINLTDGYTNFPEDGVSKRIPTLWVLSKDHIDKSQIPFGKVIEM